MIADAWLDRLCLDDEPAAPMRTSSLGPATEAEIAAYLAALNAQSVTSNAAKGYRPEVARVYSVETGGRKFLRVVAKDRTGVGRTAFLFIEVATGDLYKPAGWKGPARNFPRGNIRDLRPVAVTGGRYV